MNTQLFNYQIIEQIYESSKTLIYKGVSLVNHEPVIIKVLKNEYPTFTELVRFRNQYTLIKGLNLSGIVYPIALDRYQNSYALIMKDEGLISLKEYFNVNIKEHNFQDKLTEFLEIAPAITDILAGLYQNLIIHKDIKPSNILINPQTKEVKLIDFSLSSLLPKENQSLITPNLLEGTLAYISPEQTGRMNRGIDYRTDFYSLGITFYELLTDQLPFASDDLIELVHSHIVQQPISPQNIKSEIPEVLSNIILKLMGKSPDQRYQTALGIRYDLEQCQQQLKEKNYITSFQLATRDRSDRFIISEKLYGRETEVKILLDAFTRISKSPQSPVTKERNKAVEMMLVAGYSGVGKTAVVNEVQKPIVRQRGYFIKGKFDKFQRNIPFSALVQALRELMAQLLTQSVESLTQWKESILQVLGNNGQILIDVIPELEIIIGRQSPVTELSGNAGQNRFNLLFENFIKLFAKKDHPLVIFLDDLQWIDLASLNLIKIIISEFNQQNLNSEETEASLLLIGAYRDNEVNASHPLILTLEEMRKEGAIINQITLSPLTKNDLNLLISDTLSCTLRLALPLTELVDQKTQGNPFFATQFLKALYTDNYIYFQSKLGYWQCDIAQIQQLALTNNVVEFMSIQLQKLPSQTQEFLQLAACIGNQFEIETLAIVSQKSIQETAKYLWSALKEEFIIPINETYKFFYQQETEENLIKDNFDSKITYKFLHDRVQQAAYLLIPESEKQITHVKIGQLLLANIPEKDREENIFKIVNQLNYGVDLITNIQEKIQLTKLNLIAGNKALISTAYKAAIEYFNIGMILLTEESWQNNYQLRLELSTKTAESAYLNGDFEAMENQILIVLNNAKNLLDTINIYQVKIQALIAQNNLLEAVNTAFNILKKLEIEFPDLEKINQNDVNLALKETANNLKGKNLTDLSNLPIMKDENKIGAIAILAIVSSAAYIGFPLLYPLIILKQINLSLKYGNCPNSAYAYATYGLIICAFTPNIDQGYESGEIALYLLEKFNATKLKAKVFNLVYPFIRPWKNPLQQSLKPLLEGYQSGLETGDLEFAAYCIYNYCSLSYLQGNELSDLAKEMKIYGDAIRHLKQDTAYNFHRIYWQSVLNLLGKNEIPFELKGDIYNKEIMVSIHKQANDTFSIGTFYINQLILYYLFENIEKAQEIALEGEAYINGVAGYNVFALFYFYQSLTLLTNFNQNSVEKQAQILEKVTLNQEKIHHWATYAPMNFLHKYYLVEAEKNRVLDQKLEAIENYEKAIKLARENNYLQEAGLSNELLGKFYLSWGKEKIAKIYLSDAYYYYSCWGAKAKINDLEKKYPQLITPLLKQHYSLGENTTETLASSISTSGNLLDLNTVIKASQVISESIEINHFLSNFMKVIIENSGGANSGILLRLEEDKFIISIQCSTSQCCLFPNIKIEKFKDIPQSIINYVIQHKTALIIDNIEDEILFAGDPYLIQKQPKAILCLPIIRFEKLIAILYLENDQTPQVFNSDRLKLLNILTSQAAISLENALLYQKSKNYSNILEETVTQRTQELKDKNEILEQTLEKLTITQKQMIAQEKLASLGSLTAGISHELKNPLNFINNFSDISLSILNQIEEELNLNSNNIIEHLTILKECANAINQQGDKANQIINTMLMHSRQESGELELRNINQLLSESVQFVIQSLQGNWSDFCIKIETNYDQSMEKSLVIPQSMSRCFTNLINNACYSLYQKQQLNPNFVPILTIKTANLQEIIEIKIKDNGEGIAPEIMEKIFEPFFTTKPTGEGTGLGLSLTNDIIVGQHQGTININSKLGNYTEFIINLPKKIA